MWDDRVRWAFAFMMKEPTLAKFFSRAIVKEELDWAKFKDQYYPRAKMVKACKAIKWEKVTLTKKPASQKVLDLLWKTYK
jgi:hypothetical protein